MPAVVVDTSVLISLAAGGQFQLLRDLYTTLYLPPAVWSEATGAPAAWGAREVSEARRAGWLIVQPPADMTRIASLPFRLQRGEAEALAFALELPDSLLLVDDAPGRRAAETLHIAYTGTVGVLLRAKNEGKLPLLRPVLDLMFQRTLFRLSQSVYQAVLKHAGEQP